MSREHSGGGSAIGLRFLLGLAALVCLVGLVPLLATAEMVEAAVRRLGMTPPAPSALFEYALRAAGGCLAGLAFFYLKLATHPHRYGSLVAVGGLALALVGTACLVAGLAAGLTNLWVLCAPAVPLLLGLAIYISWYAARKRR